MEIASSEDGPGDGEVEVGFSSVCAGVGVAAVAEDTG